MSVKQGFKYDREGMEEHSSLCTDECELSKSIPFSSVNKLILPKYSNVGQRRKSCELHV